MSNLVVQTNVLALNSHRNLGVIGAKQSTSSARLSSGYRINSAADDAAGLAISEKMRSQIRGLDQASTNAQDASSLIQTAEGGMNEIDNMIQRMRELVVQASNDTNDQKTTTDNQGDRQKIQDEIDQLMDEIDSMSDRVEFNKKTLINGTYSADGSYSKALQDSMKTSVQAAQDILDPAEEQYNTTSTTALTASNTALAASNTYLTASTATITSSSAYLAASNVELADSTVEIALSTAVVAAGAASTTTQVNDYLAASAAYLASSSAYIAASSAYIAASNTELASSTVADAQSTAYIAQSTALISASTAYSNAQTLYNETVATVKGTDADIKGSALYFQIGANSNQGLEMEIGSVTTRSLGIGLGLGRVGGELDVMHITGSETTGLLDKLDAALTVVTTERSKLGAAQNRLSYTQSSLDISSENLSAAQSRIRDTDMAQEMMALTAANVLQQAGVSMLSQANQSPQSILQLLQ